MSAAGQKVVFFDLTGTLGVERASWDGARMASFLAYPDVRADLVGLLSDTRLGVVVVDRALERGHLEKALGGTYLDQFIDRSLALLFRPDEPDLFASALREAGLENAPERAVYVSLDAGYRGRAHQAGMRTAPHPLFARAVLDGQDLYYIRIAARELDYGHDWAPVIGHLPVAPLLDTHERVPVLYAIGTDRLPSLLPDSFEVQQLGEARDVAATTPVVDTTVYLLQVTDEEFERSERLQEFLEALPSQLPLVQKTRGGWLVAVPSSRSIDEFASRTSATDASVSCFPTASRSRRSQPAAGRARAKRLRARCPVLIRTPGAGHG